MNAKVFSTRQPLNFPDSILVYLVDLNRFSDAKCKLMLALAHGELQTDENNATDEEKIRAARYLEFQKKTFDKHKAHALTSP